MQDDFICPKCNSATRFDGALPTERVAARDIRCRCGEHFIVIVNGGCRVLEYRRIET
jgi:hypothetical protein